MKLNTVFTKIIAVVLAIGLTIPSPAYAARAVATGQKLVTGRTTPGINNLAAALTGSSGRGDVSAGLVAVRAEIRDYFDERAADIAQYAATTGGELPTERMKVIRKHRIQDFLNSPTGFALEKLTPSEREALWSTGFEFMVELARAGKKIMHSIPAAGKASRMAKGYLAPFFIKVMRLHPEKFVDTEKLTQEDWTVIDAKFQGNWKAYVKSLEVNFKEVEKDGKKELVPANLIDEQNHAVLDRLFHEDRALLPADEETQLTEVTLLNVKVANDYFESLGLGRPIVACAMKNEQFYRNFIRYTFLNNHWLGLNIRFVDMRTGAEVKPDQQYLESLDERDLQAYLKNIDLDHEYKNSELLVYNQPPKPVFGASVAVVESMWKEDLANTQKAQDILTAVKAGHEPGKPEVALTPAREKKLTGNADTLLKSRSFLGSEEAYHNARKLAAQYGGKAIREAKAMVPAGHSWVHLSRFLANVGSRNKPLLVTMAERGIVLDFTHNADNGALIDEDWFLILGKMVQGGNLVALEDSRKPNTERGSGGGANVFVEDPNGNLEVNLMGEDGKLLPQTVRGFLRQAEFAPTADSVKTDPVTGRPFSPLYNGKGETVRDEQDPYLLTNNASLTAFMPDFDSVTGKIKGNDAYSALVGKEQLEVALQASLQGDYSQLEALVPVMQARMTRFLSKKTLKNPFVAKPGPLDLFAVVREEGVAWDVQLGDGVLPKLLLALTPSVVDVEEGRVSPGSERFNPVKDRGYGLYQAGIQSKSAQVKRIKEGRIFSPAFRRIAQKLAAARSEARLPDRQAREEFSRDFGAYVGWLSEGDAVSDDNPPDVVVMTGNPDIDNYLALIEQWQRWYAGGYKVPVVLAGGQGRGTPFMYEAVRKFLEDHRISDVTMPVWSDTIKETDLFQILFRAFQVGPGESVYDAMQRDSLLQVEEKPSANTAQNYEYTKSLTEGIIARLAIRDRSPKILIVTRPDLLRRVVPSAYNVWGHTGEWEILRYNGRPMDISSATDSQLMNWFVYTVLGGQIAKLDTPFDPANLELVGEIKGVRDQSRIFKEKTNLDRYPAEVLRDGEALFTKAVTSGLRFYRALKADPGTQVFHDPQTNRFTVLSRAETRSPEKGGKAAKSPASKSVLDIRFNDFADQRALWHAVHEKLKALPQALQTQIKLQIQGQGFTFDIPRDRRPYADETHGIADGSNGEGVDMIVVSGRSGGSKKVQFDFSGGTVTCTIADGWSSGGESAASTYNDWGGTTSVVRMSPSSFRFKGSAVRTSSSRGGWPARTAVHTKNTIPPMNVSQKASLAVGFRIMPSGDVQLLMSPEGMQFLKDKQTKYELNLAYLQGVLSFVRASAVRAETRAGEAGNKYFFADVTGQETWEEMNAKLTPERIEAVVAAVQAGVDAYLAGEVAAQKITEEKRQESMRATLTNFREWISSPFIDQYTKRGILKAVAKGRWQDINTAYTAEYDKKGNMKPPLPFGTAGVRGPAALGEEDLQEFSDKGFHSEHLKGPALVNNVTLAQLATGVARSFISRGRKTTVITYDSRIYGTALADLVAAIYLKEGLVVHIFDQTAPMPEMALTVAMLHLDFGNLISASHNPAESNGIKVSNWRGAQLDPETRNAVVKATFDPKTGVKFADIATILRASVDLKDPHAVYKIPAGSDDLGPLVEQFAKGLPPERVIVLESRNIERDSNGRRHIDIHNPHADYTVSHVLMLLAKFREIAGNMVVRYCTFYGNGLAAAKRTLIDRLGVKPENFEAIKEYLMNHLYTPEGQTNPDGSKILPAGFFPRFRYRTAPVLNPKTGQVEIKPNGIIPDPGNSAGQAYAWEMAFADLILQNGGDVAKALRGVDFTGGNDPDSDRFGAVVTMVERELKKVYPNGLPGQLSPIPVKGFPKEEVARVAQLIAYILPLEKRRELGFTGAALLTANDTWITINKYRIDRFGEMMQAGRIPKGLKFTIVKTHVTTDGLNALATYAKNKWGLEVEIREPFVGFTLCALEMIWSWKHLMVNMSANEESAGFSIAGAGPIIYTLLALFNKHEDYQIEMRDGAIHVNHDEPVMALSEEDYDADPAKRGNLQKSYFGYSRKEIAETLSYLREQGVLKEENGKWTLQADFKALRSDEAKYWKAFEEDRTQDGQVVKSIIEAAPGDRLGKRGHTLEKDGFLALNLMFEVAVWAKAHGMTLYDYIKNEIYLNQDVGLFATINIAAEFAAGVAGQAAKIRMLQSAMDMALSVVRGEEVRIGGKKVTRIELYIPKEGKYTQPKDFPFERYGELMPYLSNPALRNQAWLEGNGFFPEEGVRFYLEDGSHITPRPSGTENKVRVYVQKVSKASDLAGTSGTTSEVATVHVAVPETVPVSQTDTQGTVDDNITDTIVGAYNLATTMRDLVQKRSENRIDFSAVIGKGSLVPTNRAEVRGAFTSSFQEPVIFDGAFAFDPEAPGLFAIPALAADNPSVVIARNRAEARMLEDFNAQLPAGIPQILVAYSPDEAVTLLRQAMAERVRRGLAKAGTKIRAIVTASSTNIVALKNQIGDQGIFVATKGWLMRIADRAGLTAMIERFAAELHAISTAA